MTGAFRSVAGVTGAVLAGVVVAGIMIVAGINPLLSALAAGILVLDVLYYRRRSSVDTDAAMQELATTSAGRGAAGDRHR